LSERPTKATSPPLFAQNASDAVQKLVVVEVLELLPKHLTLDEISKRLGQEPGRFALDRAVDQLVEDELIRFDRDKAILPSRSLMRISELWEDLWAIC